MPDVLGGGGGGGGVINKIRCKMKGSSSPSYIEFNQQLITDRRSICSLFNTYFTDVANKLNSDKYHNAPLHLKTSEFRQFRTLCYNIGRKEC